MLRSFMGKKGYGELCVFSLLNELYLRYVYGGMSLESHVQMPSRFSKSDMHVMPTLAGNYIRIFYLIVALAFGS